MTKMQCKMCRLWFPPKELDGRGRPLLEVDGNLTRGEIEDPTEVWCIFCDDPASASRGEYDHCIRGSLTPDGLPVEASNKTPRQTIIVVTKRGDDYHASLETESERWAVSKTVDGSIGNLVSSHPERFGVEIRIE